MVSVRQVKLKSGVQVNLGRGLKVHNRAMQTGSEKKRGPVGTMSAQQMQDQVDEKAERRKRLLAKLPVIENDPAAQQHVISTINRQLVEAHNELDRLKLQRVKKRERLRELRDKYADTCRDSGVAPGVCAPPPPTRHPLTPPPTLHTHHHLHHLHHLSLSDCVSHTLCAQSRWARRARGRARRWSFRRVRSTQGCCGCRRSSPS